MGISPLVEMIERQTAIPDRHAACRAGWRSCIIYAAIIGALVAVGMIVIPPLVDQAEELWRTLPDKIEQAQQRRWCASGSCGSPSRSAKRCSRRRPPAARRAVATIFGAVRNVVGGVFGIITLLLLTFYMLVESREIFSFFVRLFPRHAARRGSRRSAPP